MTIQRVQEQEKHLISVLSSRRFLEMEGLGNEVPFFIYPYDPEDSLAVAAAKKRIKNKLKTDHGVSVLEVNLYDLTVEILKERGDWDELLEVETEVEKGDFSGVLSSMLNSQQHVAPAIAAKISERHFDVLFLTGIGEVFPYLRSHSVLNNLQSVAVQKPMLMFFPGEYKRSESAGSSLVLFGRLKDDNYYRAFDILQREA